MWVSLKTMTTYRKSGDDPALESESLPFDSYRQCGQNPEVIDRSNHRRYHKQALIWEDLRQHEWASATNSWHTNLTVWHQDPHQKQDLMDLNRSQRRQARNKFESLQLTKRPTANHTELNFVEDWSPPETEMLPQQQRLTASNGQPKLLPQTRDPPQEPKSDGSQQKLTHQFPKNRYQFKWWFHCLNPTDKRSESHSMNVCSQRRMGTSLQRKRPRNHLMEGQPILISAGS